MPSAEFRKRFVRLREVTRVESNGHYIGIWVPVGSGGLVTIAKIYDLSKELGDLGLDMDEISRRIILGKEGD